ncbi:MAG TPA: hypothetical protein G4O08_04300 [Anaerolineae bacterium]|nr:hypothetical protein [Anaerolineae bacterium]
MRRSARWVVSLGKRFEQEFPDRKKHRVFWKGNQRNRREFTLTEFMYDISVCEIGFVRSAAQGKQLGFIRKAIWQIESEFAKDSREALIDFSKLVAGSGQNKLFIAPVVHDEAAFLRVLREPAVHCSGNVYLAMVPKPKEWPSSADRIGLWRLEEGEWRLNR